MYIYIITLINVIVENERRKVEENERGESKEKTK